MAPSCQSRMLQLLTSILLFCVLTVSALPQPNPQHHKTVAPRAYVPVTLVSDPAPDDMSTDFDSFLEQGSKLLKSLFGSFLRWGQNGGNGGAISTTIQITPTPVEASSRDIVRTVYVTVYPSHSRHRLSRSRTAPTITGSAISEAASEVTVLITIPSAVPETAVSELPVFTLLPPTGVSKARGPYANATVTSSASIAAVSSEPEIIFSILPVWPIPSPDLGLNDTTTIISYATALPLSDYGPGFPTFIPVPSGSVPSRSIYSALPAHSTGPWSNSTRNGVTGRTGTGAPLITGTGIPAVEQNTTTVLHLKSTTTVYITLPYMWPNSTAPRPTATGIGSGEETNTTTVIHYTRTTVKYITRTVKPFPLTAIPATLLPASNTPTPPKIASIAIPPYLNSSSSVSSPYPTASAPISPSDIPILIPGPTIGSNATYGTLAALRRLCTLPNPQRAPLTLPLFNYFYGPSAYPVMNLFPGCSPPNPSQSLRAPGLLNCTLLGIEVQRCQQNGRRVLLSVKGSSVTEVGGNFDYGIVGQVAQPFGSYFGEDAREVEDVGNDNGNGTNRKQHPNLFDPTHPPTSLALTLSSLFGETRTERADLRPLGPETTSPGINWLTRPLGEEVVVDGFDVQIPREWKGTVQGGLFEDFVQRLRELNDESWADSGAKKGGKNDLGIDGKGVVLVGWL